MLSWDLVLGMEASVDLDAPTALTNPDGDVDLAHQMRVEGGDVDLDAPPPLKSVEVARFGGGGHYRGRRGSAAAWVGEEGWAWEEGLVWGRSGRAHV